MKVETAKIVTWFIAALSLAIQAPQKANAQDSAQTTPVNKLSSQSVSAALHAVKANGTRPVVENSRVHILPTPTARSTLPAIVRNRTNFYGFDPTKATLSPVLTAPVPGISIPPNNIHGALQKAVPSPAAKLGIEWNPANLLVFGGDPDGNVTGLPSAKQVNVYLNCPTHNDGCWGNGAGSITTFQSNLTKSTFITIVDQYVGATAKGRYPLSSQFFADVVLPVTPWNSSTPLLLDSEAQAIAFAAANANNGFGFGFVYHVFVPPGTDVCFDNSTVCYSPDNLNNFFFCGYHESFDLSGNHILYTVEPWGVPCTASPVQSATDAQVSVLSHETFETITDPDPNFEWNSPVGIGEIGDNCEPSVGEFLYGNPEIYPVSLNKHIYNIQLEYSNKGFGCRTMP
ncbi:MAG TPA: hypothetical protein VIE66_01850 [Methylocella sp.]